MGRREALDCRRQHGAGIGVAIGRVIKLRQRQRGAQFEAARLLRLRDRDRGKDPSAAAGSAGSRFSRISARMRCISASYQRSSVRSSWASASSKRRSPTSVSPALASASGRQLHDRRRRVPNAENLTESYGAALKRLRNTDRTLDQGQRRRRARLLSRPAQCMSKPWGGVGNSAWLIVLRATPSSPGALLKLRLTRSRFSINWFLVSAQ